MLGAGDFLSSDHLGSVAAFIYVSSPLPWHFVEHGRRGEKIFVVKKSFSWTFFIGAVYSSTRLTGIVVVMQHVI